MSVQVFDCIQDVSEPVFDRIFDVDLDIRPQLWAHIVIVGKTAQLPGFQTRLEKELRILYQKHILVPGTANPAQSILKRVKLELVKRSTVFDGGSALADLIKTQPESWIQRLDYDRLGKTGELVVAVKC